MLNTMGGTPRREARQREDFQSFTFASRENKFPSTFGGISFPILPITQQYLDYVKVLKATNSLGRS